MENEYKLVGFDTFDESWYPLPGEYRDGYRHLPHRGDTITIFQLWRIGFMGIQTVNS